MIVQTLAMHDKVSATSILRQTGPIDEQMSILDELDENRLLSKLVVLLLFEHVAELCLCLTGTRNCRSPFSVASPFFLPCIAKELSVIVSTKKSNSHSSSLASGSREKQARGTFNSQPRMKSYRDRIMARHGLPLPE